MGARRIAVVAPYMKPLTQLVMDYIAGEGFEVVDQRALEIPDNLEVGRHDPARLPAIVAGMNLSRADAIVLSACVQMPSLPVVAQVEAMTGKPVITAAIATTYAMLKALDMERIVPGAGALLIRSVLSPPRSAPRFPSRRRREADRQSRLRRIPDLARPV